MTFLLLAASFITGFALCMLILGKSLRGITTFLDESNTNTNALIEMAPYLPSIEHLCSAVNRKLTDYRKELRKAEQENSNLMRGLSELSHDIKTPLAGAKGHAQLALNSRENQAAIEQHLKGAISRIDDADAILENLSSYARANDPDQTLKLESLRLLPVLLNILDGYEPQLNSDDWAVNLILDDENAQAHANANALQRIIENLISNALRYGASPLECRLDEHFLSISNTVLNPDEIEPEKLFERFYRADSSRSKPGSGLGLPTARKLASKMDMSLTAQVEGGTITFVLAF